MKEKALNKIRKQLDDLYLEHGSYKNWKITKSVLQTVIDILNEADCNPAPAQRKAIYELMQREFRI